MARQTLCLPLAISPKSVHGKNPEAAYDLRALFLAVAVVAAFFAAHRFRSASESLLRPSGVMPPLRVAFAGAALVAAAAGVSAFLAAHRARSASESLRRPSGVMPPLRFALGPRAGAADTTEAAGVATSATGPSISRKAASARSIPARCCSSFLITSLRLFAIVSPVWVLDTTNTNHTPYNGEFLPRPVATSKAGYRSEMHRTTLGVSAP